MGRSVFAQCPVGAVPPVSSAGCSIGDAIDAFSLNGIGTTGNYGCSGAQGYTLFNAPVRNLTAGGSYSFSATTGVSGTYTYPQYFAIWIDVNNDSYYDSTEMLYSSQVSTTTHNGAITIPPYAAPGNNIRMRTRCSYTAKILPNQACAQFAWGETEDYLVNIAAPCSGPPVLTFESPDTTLACGFGNMRFSVDALGNNLQFQWQIKNGPAWHNLNNGGVYSGTNTRHLDINGYTPDFASNRYRCVINNACAAVASSSMRLFIDSSPVYVQPVSETVCEGSSVALSFTMKSAGTFHTYQWYSRTPAGTIAALAAGGLYTGVDTPLLVMSSAPASVDGYNYFCLIDNGCWSTDTVSLTVKRNPVITSQPKNDTVCKGEVSTFSVSAQGTNLAYQWQVFNSTGWQNLANAGHYSNVNTATLTVQNPDLSNHGKTYRCEVGADCDTVHSQPAQLAVFDGFSITAQPHDSTACYKTAATFKVVTMSSSPLTYQWMVITSTGIHVPVDTPLYLHGASAEMIVPSASKWLDSTVYYCIISNRCTSDTTIFVTLRTEPCDGDNISTDIQEPDQKPILSVYPNPANGGKINIAASFSARTASVRIVNRMGMAVHAADYDIPNNNIITLDIDRLPPGVYSIQVHENGQALRTVRFIKE